MGPASAGFVVLEKVVDLPNTCPHTILSPRRRHAGKQKPRCAGLLESRRPDSNRGPFITSEVLYQLSYVGVAVSLALETSRRPARFRPVRRSR